MTAKTGKMKQLFIRARNGEFITPLIAEHEAWLKERLPKKKDIRKIVRQHFTVNKRVVILKPNLATAIRQDLENRLLNKGGING